MEGQSFTMNAVRAALRSFGANGQEIRNVYLHEALGLESNAEKALLRERIKDMVQRDEVRRVRTGVYIYNFGYRPRENKAHPAIWRFVRKSKPGWTVGECVMMTDVSHSHVLRYLGWLKKEGYVESIGKNGRGGARYAATPKTDLTPETPYPPIGNRDDPLARERVAAATIVRLLHCAKPDAAKTSRDIVDACNTLLARFSKPVIETENVQN